jgi:predicted dehydrogenase
MAAHPEVDLIVVCVRVPGHRELVMAGLQAGKPVFCEWPLGANLAEAEEMAGLARQRSLKTIVGPQARSDTLTIAGGHAIDALCAVLGEFAELSARVSTRIPEWRTLEGEPVAVDAPEVSMSSAEW